MAKDDMLYYVLIVVGLGVVFMTENPVKDAIYVQMPSLKTSIDSLNTSITSIVKGATAAATPTPPAANPTAPAPTPQGKHKGGHGRNRHSNAAYMDCGY